ncbi:RluA family pseudouridine synthase [Desulfobulbus elongatus]|uniref:RluA family pseudouridine synthase n=1 Tax=Desulfobulbus elongatus TaxID=53332 RepID=UPI0006889666|nr:RluA family pseudouridine synthase [Desulfobulbus elongatus]
MSGQEALDIRYRDQEIVVVDKPGGLLAVPGRGPDKRDSVASRVRALVPQCIEQPAAHRLDMDTSGLMVLGLTREAHAHLSRQFAERRVDKRYLALLDGMVTGEAGEIALRFRLDPENRPYQVYDPVQGKLGISRWRKIEARDGRTLVLFTPLTGRTHQLRLHAGHPLGLGSPIVGDRLYGTGRPGERLFLHATWLRFDHPATGQRLTFASFPSFAGVQLADWSES